MSTKIKYSDYLAVDEKFQTAINLVYDLNSIKKLNSYIPTAQGVQIIDKYLRTIYYDSTERASVLIGPYGRGKSHLMLVLLALISLNPAEREDKKAIDKLIEKIAQVSKETAQLAQEVAYHHKRLLPVVINSTGSDVSQAFTLAIKDALDRSGQANLLPATYFDVACSTIDTWEEEYPTAIEGFAKELLAQKYTVSQLKQALRECQHEAYDVFCEVYPHVALGASFNPLVNADVVKLYQAVNFALTEKDTYSGMFVVFDEFSKYLESHLDSKNMMDFKAIQDFAELAERSGEKQFHIVCVTHKEILDYSKSDSFKTVAGRFASIRFTTSSEQSYELISNSIQKKATFDHFCKQHEEDFSQASQHEAATGLFRDIPEDIFNRVLVRGCFPLAPITAYCLLRVSEKVAQNERTMFTFISRSEKGTVGDFLRREDKKLQFITVESIYDYFEDLFRKERFNQSVYTAWAKADTALHKVENDPNQSKIIKAIALFQIVNDGRLVADRVQLKASLLMSDGDFNKAIEEMASAHLLVRKDSGAFVMLTANGIDVRRIVENKINARPIEVDETAVLNLFLDDSVVLPREYNEHFCMIRYFRIVYITANQFASIRSATQLLEKNHADGIILNIVYGNEKEKEKAVNHISTFSENLEIIICVPENLVVDHNLFQQYEAIQIVRNQNENLDEHMRDELQLYENDLRDTIRSSIMSEFAANCHNSHFYNATGELIGIRKQVQLVKQVSAICMKRYNKTPVIRNEMINRQHLSAPLLKARTAVINWLLTHNDGVPLTVMPGLGPEVSAFRATIQNKGLSNREKSNDSSLNDVLAAIKKFLFGCEKYAVSFDEIYSKLTSGAISMRKGTIPIYLSYVFSQYKDDIVLYFSGKEIPFNAKIFNRIDEEPSAFKIRLEQGTQEQDAYLTLLETAFSEYYVENGGEGRMADLAARMQSWVRALPKYTRESLKRSITDSKDTFPAELINLRHELLRINVSPRELILVTIPEHVFAMDDVLQCGKKVLGYKALLDHHLDDKREEMIAFLKNQFVKGYDGELPGAVTAWYSTLKTETKSHVFDRAQNSLLEFAAENENHDQIAVFNKLLQILTPMAFPDWNDAICQNFMEEMHSVIEGIERFQKGASQDSSMRNIHNECQIIIENETKIWKCGFNKIQINGMVENLYNIVKADVENSGLSEEETLAVLAKLIQERI